MTPTTSDQFYNATKLVATPCTGFLLLDDSFARAPRSAGGILLPEASDDKKKEPMGRILKVGKGLEADFKPGEVVVYRRTQDFVFEAGGIKYRFLKPEAVLCKLELP